MDSAVPPAFGSPRRFAPVLPNTHTPATTIDPGSAPVVVADGSSEMKRPELSVASSGPTASAADIPTPLLSTRFLPQRPKQSFATPTAAPNPAIGDTALNATPIATGSGGGGAAIGIGSVPLLPINQLLQSLTPVGGRSAGTAHHNKHRTQRSTDTASDRSRYQRQNQFSHLLSRGRPLQPRKPSAAVEPTAIAPPNPKARLSLPPSREAKYAGGIDGTEPTTNGLTGIGRFPFAPARSGGAASSESKSQALTDRTDRTDRFDPSAGGLLKHTDVYPAHKRLLRHRYPNAHSSRLRQPAACATFREACANVGVRHKHKPHAPLASRANGSSTSGGSLSARKPGAGGGGGGAGGTGSAADLTHELLVSLTHSRNPKLQTLKAEHTRWLIQHKKFVAPPLTSHQLIEVEHLYHVLLDHHDDTTAVGPSDGPSDRDHPPQPPTAGAGLTKSALAEALRVLGWCDPQRAASRLFDEMSLQIDSRISFPEFVRIINDDRTKPKSHLLKLTKTDKLYADISAKHAKKLGGGGAAGDSSGGGGGSSSSDAHAVMDAAAAVAAGKCGSGGVAQRTDVFAAGGSGGGEGLPLQFVILGLKRHRLMESIENRYLSMDPNRCDRFPCTILVVRGGLHSLATGTGGTISVAGSETTPAASPPPPITLSSPALSAVAGSVLDSELRLSSPPPLPLPPSIAAVGAATLSTAAAAAASGGGAGGVSGAGGGSGSTYRIVELLNKMGYRSVASSGTATGGVASPAAVDYANSFVEALELCSGRRYDLIFIDMKMRAATTTASTASGTITWDALSIGKQLLTVSAAAAATAGANSSAVGCSSAASGPVSSPPGSGGLGRRKQSRAGLPTTTQLLGASAATLSTTAKSKAAVRPSVPPSPFIGSQAAVDGSSAPRPPVLIAVTTESAIRASDVPAPGSSGSSDLPPLVREPSTTAVSSELIARWSAAGFRDFLTKPIQVVDLANLITKWIPERPALAPPSPGSVTTPVFAATAAPAGADVPPSATVRRSRRGRSSGGGQ